MKRLLILVFLIPCACSSSTPPISSAFKPLAHEKDPAYVPIGQASVVQAEPNTLFNGWKLTPAGKQARVAENPLKMVMSPDGKTLAAVCSGQHPGVALLDVETQLTTQFVPLPRTLNGIAFSHDGKTLFVTGGNSDSIYKIAIDDGKATNVHTVSLMPGQDQKVRDDFLTGIAVHPFTGKLYICSQKTSEVWVVDPDSGKLESVFRAGLHPYACVFGINPRYLFVSNWGERSVSSIDVVKGQTITRTPTGVRPNEMALAPDGRLFVACAGDNTVHVIQTRAPKDLSPESGEEAPPPEASIEILATSLYPSSPEGSTPDGVDVSPDGNALFVANADNNNIAVIDIDDPKVSRVVGFVPTGWYPSSVASDGKTLFVANSKGLRSRANTPAITDKKRTMSPTTITYDPEASILVGSVSFINPPNGEELNAYTKQVKANCPYTPEALKRASTPPPNSIIPLKPGDPCPIKHVLYIIKENRTYDQVLGDMKDASGKPIGNGDPHLTLFGEDISPNHHQLAREYVLLDNLYCSGEVSLDGHSWCDGAIANDFRQRAWITRYTGHGHLLGNFELWDPAGGYIWDLCKRHGVSFKCYGEGANRVPVNNRGTWGGGRDMHKVDGWIKDLNDAEKTGDLPQFMIMSLGEDHTFGTTPGQHTPQSCVASNDIGLAKIVAAASRSKFWNSMAIFVIEDDAQNGPDHVDSHRTVGFVLSPYTRRGTVDSTPYTTVSMIRTMELILGLPPMTQYDAGATVMHECFQREPSSVPYTVLTPKVDLNAKNTKDSPGAAASAAMDWDEYDETPEDELNRILWLAVKGPNVPYQVPIHRFVFTN